MGKPTKSARDQIIIAPTVHSRGELITMQISITAQNSSKRDAMEAIGKYQESGNYQIVRDADSGHAQAQISQKHRDMTGEHEWMN